MKRDAWATAYRDGMASARHEADVSLDSAKRRLDAAMANVRATPGELFTAWLQFRTVTTMHQTVATLEGDSTAFFDMLGHSASGRMGKGN